ncbi:hypothetical protein IFR05_010517 [Cadophora sp. M221]|nr:hypothetical protein IFR05_010517 [Cadophora sp. M221]
MASSASSKYYSASYQWVNPAFPLPPVNDNLQAPVATSSLEATGFATSISSDQNTATAETPPLPAGETTSTTEYSSNFTEGDTSTDIKLSVLSADEDALATGVEITKFTHFPKLPFELRSMIFTLACFEPRVIDIWAVELEIANNIGTTDLRADTILFRFRSQAERPPSLLHASHESRTVSLKHYSLGFNTSFT